MATGSSDDRGPGAAGDAVVEVLGESCGRGPGAADGAIEEVLVESSSPPRPAAPALDARVESGGSGGGEGGGANIYREVFERLVAGGYLEAAAAASVPEQRALLEAHFARLSARPAVSGADSSSCITPVIAFVALGGSGGGGGGGRLHDICREMFVQLAVAASGPEFRAQLASRSQLPAQKKGGVQVRRLQKIKMKIRGEKLKQQKMMESFKAILSDSIAFLFPTMLTVFTSDFEFNEYEKIILVAMFAMGGLLILLTMVLSHGVENGPRKTSVVSWLTLMTVIYVSAVLDYCLYKFLPAEGVYEALGLHLSVDHFIFGVVVLTVVWENLFKMPSQAVLDGAPRR